MPALHVITHKDEVAEMGLAEEISYSAQADTLNIVCELHEHGIVAVTR